MSRETFTALGRVRDVEREYMAQQSAAQYFLQAQQRGEIEFGRDFAWRDIHRATDNLEATYVIRVFIEFERALRCFLRSKGIKVPRRAEPLVNRVAARARVAGDALMNIHRARRYRNKLVHDILDEREVLTIREVTRFACIFIDRLRGAWR